MSVRLEGRRTAQRVAWYNRVWMWVRTHKTSLIVPAVLLTVVGLTSGWNFAGYPGTVNDDEGTYTVQAWAVLYRGQLAHYTYWYDHPPLGWIQIAGYAWLTRGFQRAAVSVMMVREVMLIANIVSSALIYLIMRRLQFHRITASSASLLFALSPLAIYYHRMVFLDNLEIMWVLAAMVFAVSPRRNLSSAFGTAVCMALATLTKETAGTLLPVILWLLWQNHPRGHRSWSFGVFFTGYIGCSAMYLLYAVLKGELIPGPGHVSLLGSLWWQMFGRGDIPGELPQLIKFWLSWDSWVPSIALVAIPSGFIFRRMRAITFGFAVQVVMMFETGYVPRPYVICLLPFAALLIAGVSEELWRLRPLNSSKSSSSQWRVLAWGVNRTGPVAVLALTLVFSTMGLSQWSGSLHAEMTRHTVDYYRQMNSWVVANIPKSARLVVDDNMWPDLQREGYGRIDWFYKVDLDPAVRKKYLAGYQSIDFVIIDRVTNNVYNLPTVLGAINHSDKIASFGDSELDYTVYKVRHT